MFNPRFEITSGMTGALMAIEGDRQAVEVLPVDVQVLSGLRETARLRATHYSTQIEGNRLTQAQVHETILGGRFPGRERDELEVRHYYAALEHVEKWARERREVSEIEVQRIHALVMTGRVSESVYRDGQNVIRDSGTGEMVYLPPEAKDVPRLMRELVEWIGTTRQAGQMPLPLIAAIAHYQFATIHPYYDGNGRSARLLTTLILHRFGYGLKGIYALEEYYARDLQGYYSALSVGPSHNYYGGRAEAKITPFLEYFLAGMRASFASVRVRAEDAAQRGGVDHSGLLRSLDPKQRAVMELFGRQRVVRSRNLSEALGLSAGTTRALCRDWVREGFLVMDDASKKNRLYRLGDEYERVVGGR